MGSGIQHYNLPWTDRGTSFAPSDFQYFTSLSSVPNPTLTPAPLSPRRCTNHASVEHSMLDGCAAWVLVVEVLGDNMHETLLLQLLRGQDAETDVRAAGGGGAGVRRGGSVTGGREV